MLGCLNLLQLHGLNLKCMSSNPYFPSQSTSIFAVIEEIHGFLANIHLFLFIFPISIKICVAQSTLKFVQNRHGPSLPSWTSAPSCGDALPGHGRQQLGQALPGDDACAVHVPALEDLLEVVEAMGRLGDLGIPPIVGKIVGIWIHE